MRLRFPLLLRFACLALLALAWPGGAQGGPGVPLALYLALTTSPAAAVTMSRDYISFADLCVGKTAGPLCFTITNTGGAPLAISSIGLVNCTSSNHPVYVDCASVAGFKIVSGSGPGTLSPGQSRDVCITFSPQEAGTFDGSVAISTDASATPAVVRLHGSGDAVSLLCPAGITTVAEAGQCSARVPLTPPVATGNCQGVTVTGVRSDAKPLTDPFPIGTTTIVWTAVGAVPCQQKVTVTGGADLKIQCPADITQGADPGKCTATVSYTTTVTGGCGPATLVCTPPPGSTFPKGTTKVTCTATDGQGHQASCSFNVTVKDTEQPRLVCPADIVRNTDSGQCTAVVAYTVTATDNCGAANVVCTPAPGTAFPKGTTTVTCTATDAAGNRSTCSFKVTVNDGEPPVCHAPADIVRNTDTGQCTAVVSYVATATDNCGTPAVVCTPPPGTAFPVGTTTVTCTATDSTGNSSTCSFKVTVKDTELPRIQCPRDMDVQPDPGQCGAVVNFPAPLASDNCPGITVTCDHTPGSFFPVGTTTVNCTATDSAGNKASCSFRVTVRIPFICPDDLTVPADPGQSSAILSLTPPRTSCSGLTITSERTDGKLLTDPFPVGTTFVTWVATDASGNTALCNQRVTVVATITIEGTVTQRLGDTVTPLAGATVTLSRLSSAGPGGTVLETRTATPDLNAGGLYRFTGLPPGIYRLEKVPFSPADQASPGNNAVAIDSHTILITTVPGVTLYKVNDFVEVLSVPGVSGPLLQVTDQVAHPTGVEFFGANPPPPESDDFTSVRGVGPDGSLFLVDWAGTALIRLPPPAGTPAESLLDPDRPTAEDGVGLARLARVEISRGGVVGAVALRADNTRSIYRLQDGTLTRLGLLDGPRGPRELAIGDKGQIAYVAHVDPNDLTSPLALFQSTSGPGIELLRQRQSVVNGATVEGFSDLTGNGSGELALLVSLSFAAGSSGQAVLRTRGVTGFEVLAVTGQSVQRGGGTGVLTQLRRPRIGPDGSVVFLGAGDGFVNFFVARPGGGLVPLLPSPGTDLSIVDDTTGRRFDYEIAADGTVGLAAALANATDSTLRLISPAGQVTSVVTGRRDIEPVLRPVFGSDGLLFFLAENQEQPADRNGRFLVGLYRYRPGTGTVEPVAQPGQPIPEWANAQLLSVTQRPVVIGNDIVFGVVFGGPESLAVPTPALFRVPQTGALVEGLTAPEGLVAQEGYPETDASRLAMIRDLSFLPGGPVVAYGLMPGAGPLIAPPPAPSATAGDFAIQAVTLAAVINPLVAQGDNLGPGQLQNVLPPLLSLSPDRELFAARTSPPQTSPRLPDTEGLFTVRPTKQVDQIAVSHRDVSGLAGAQFNGFADTKLFIVGPPSTATDGRVVFKALLNQSNTPATGIFQWTPGAAPALIRGPNAPAGLLRWAAGPAGVAYVLEKPAGGAAQLLGGAAGALKPLATAGSTAVPGVGVLTDLTDMALNSAGDVFLVGTTARGAGLFRLSGNQLTAVAQQGGAVTQDRTDDAFGYTFVGGFALAPDSARGDLVFRAVVQKPGDKPRQGEFQFGQGGVVTREIATVDVDSARTLSVDALGSTLPSQSRNGISVSANLQNGSWSLVRFQLRSNGTLTPPVTIAQDKKGKLANVPRFAALDAGALLEQESDLQLKSGPVFTIDDAGNIAFMASDGKAWGVYSTPGR